MPADVCLAPPIEPADIPYRWVRDELRFPGNLANGARSKHVRFVQECLTLEGIALRIDGIFGGGTQAAVERYQGIHGLEVTGIVDETTHGLLILPFLRALAPIEPMGRSLGELVVAYAHQHLAEHPREVGGQNRGPWVRLYMKGMESLWCAGFVFFVVNQAADSQCVSFALDTTFSCDQLAQRAKNAGLFLSEQELATNPGRRSEIKPGAIFLNRRTASDWTHTGIVVSTSQQSPLTTSDYFDTIEGNTNDDGHREGYEVCARVRGFSSKDFVLID